MTTKKKGSDDADNDDWDLDDRVALTPLGMAAAGDDDDDSDDSDD